MSGEIIRIVYDVKKGPKDTQTYSVMIDDFKAVSEGRRLLSSVRFLKEFIANSTTTGKRVSSGFLSIRPFL